LKRDQKILFLTLKVFAATGGIEKVCRVAGKMLYERTISNSKKFEIFSMYDHQNDANDNKYFPSEVFNGFNENKIKFICKSIWHSRKYDTIILSHINLLIIGWFIKILMPKKRLLLFAHGIEVWNRFNYAKKIMIKKCDIIIPVSNYTANKLSDTNNININKCKVLNNSLDPFLPLGKEFKNNCKIRNRYGLKENDFVVFTLTRLSSKERYKGYDKVISALHQLKNDYSNIKYVIAGSYDDDEKKYIDKLSKEYKIENDIIIAGFIPDEDLVAHFSMADIYVMPSMKEGFGIVFIEAMNYGLPVIAGNKDGSVDALLNGELGLLVNPLEINEIKIAIEKMIKNKSLFIPDRSKLMTNFSYESYKLKFETILDC